MHTRNCGHATGDSIVTTTIHNENRTRKGHL